MAETENAVPCKNVNPSAFCVKDIVGEGYMNSGETTLGHDQAKCIKEQLAALNMEDSDKEMTSEDEMDSRGLMCLCGHNFNYADYMYQIEIQQLQEEYSLAEPKPLTWEEWDVLLTKKEMEGYDMKDLWYSKYPPKEDLEYTLVWSDTDE